MRPQQLYDLKKKCKSLEEIVTRSEPEALRNYIAEYESYFSDYKAISNFGELIEKCLEADIVYISDYHSLKLAQEGALELLNRFVEEGKQFSLCLEIVMEKYQLFIDAFLKGRISEKRFLAEIDYKHNWPYEWKNFKPFFDFAKANKVEIKGIDCYKWEHSPGKIKTMAKRIAKHAVDKPLVVLVGEGHLCPTHLPAEVNGFLEEQDKKRKQVIVLQDNKNIYWKLAKRDLENSAEVTKLQRKVYNITTTSPLMGIREELFFRSEEEFFSPEDPDGTLYDTLHSARDEMIETLVKEFHLPRIKKADYPRLFTSLNYLEAAGIEKEKIKQFETNAYGVYKMEDNIIYLVDFTINELAHECTHFVSSYFNKEARWLTKGKDPIDMFYTESIAEAIARFGTKIIEPGHIFKKGAFKKTEGYPLFRKHIKYEKNYHKASLEDTADLILEIFSSEEGTRELAFCMLGQRLGDRLYEAFQDGRFSREEARKLMVKSFKRKDSAMETYFSLIERLA